MKLGKPTTQEAMVASWLRAECDSPRFAKPIKNAVARGAIKQTLITNPDLASTDDNAQRLALLRRVSRDNLRRFPWQSMRWHQLQLESKNEVGQLYTNPGMVWLAISHGTRQLSRAAEFIASIPETHDPHSHVLAIQERIAAGEKLEPPILVTSDAQLTRPLVILEGSLRLVAHYLAESSSLPVSCLVGISPRIESWQHALETLEDIRNNFSQQGKEYA